jgi:acyl dehydratase
MRIFSSPQELIEAAGTDLGTTEWLEIDQQRINAFADATDDHQWIHLDAERAAAGPFGATIAHGYLTLSLLPRFSHELYEIRGIKAAINVGSNRVRFVHPIRVGSRIRCQTRLDSVTEIGEALQLISTQTISVDVDGKERPACVAEIVSRVMF